MCKECSKLIQKRNKCLKKYKNIFKNINEKGIDTIIEKKNNPMFWIKEKSLYYKKNNIKLFF